MGIENMVMEVCKFVYFNVWKRGLRVDFVLGCCILVLYVDAIVFYCSSRLGTEIDKKIKNWLM